jgi:hypothetical protein
VSATTGHPRGVTFWVAFAIGAAVMAFGVRGVLTDAGTHPPELLRWVVGADLVHDFVLAPFVVAVGWVIARTAPRAWRVPVQAALAASGVVLIVGWAAWRGYGRATVPDNPTVQPLDYTTAILTVWGAIWLTAAVWIAARTASRRRRDAHVTAAAASSRDDPDTLPRP